MASYIDPASPNAQFIFDVNKSPLFRKDNENFINAAGTNQLNTLKSSLLDIFLSANNVIEPHYHPNAAELVYCISGSVTVAMMNPSAKQFLGYTLTPGQIANIPQGWWHYDLANADNTHFLAIFDAPNPEVVLGSDILKYTPSNIMAHTYCLDENQWQQTVAPVQTSTYIGPYVNCNHNRTPGHSTGQSYPYPQRYQLNPFAAQYQRY